MTPLERQWRPCDSIRGTINDRRGNGGHVTPLVRQWRPCDSIRGTINGGAMEAMRLHYRDN